MPETVLGAIRRQARQRGGELAFCTPSRTWTYADLDRQSNRIAHGLASLGIGRHDRVACLTRHTADCVALTLAACKVGAACMPVNWRLAPREVAYIVGNGEARFLMADAEFAATARGSAPPSVRRIVTTDAAAGDLEPIGAWAAAFPATDTGLEPSMDDTALQLYSSGTTGLPKGVELTYRNLAAGILGSTPYEIGYRGPPDVFLNVLPAFHIAGVGIGLLTASLGGKSVVYPEFNPPEVLAAISEHRVTHAFLVPAMIQFLLQVPGVESRDFSSLQWISYGASPISEKVLIDAMRTFKCNFAQVYGLTETTGAVTVLPPEDHDPAGARRHLLRSAGRPMRGVELRVVDPATGKDAAEGAIGEVWIHTEQNMKGYWRMPEATEDVFVGRQADGSGWFRSGDAGYLSGGYLFLHDRIKDMIVSGGENIYPAEIENVLADHPDVADVAVIGVPDEKWGEAVKAIVVPRSGRKPEARDLIAFARERLAHFKCPSSVDFAEALPRNPSGKLLKRVLREAYWRGRERRIN
jgi:acyl-CoA synthetase (AMP-forming)/AMP-acid ligase II